MLERGQRVRVHLNLHRGDFSVADPGTGKIITNVENITLSGVTFRVQPALLAKIRAWKRRKVCAYAVGRIEAVNAPIQLAGMERVTFNPFRSDTFTNDQGAPVLAADRVVFAERYGWQ